MLRIESLQVRRTTGMFGVRKTKEIALIHIKFFLTGKQVKFGDLSNHDWGKKKKPVGDFVIFRPGAEGNTTIYFFWPYLYSVNNSRDPQLKVSQVKLFTFTTKETQLFPS